MHRRVGAVRARRPRGSFAEEHRTHAARRIEHDTIAPAGAGGEHAGGRFVSFRELTVGTHLPNTRSAPPAREAEVGGDVRIEDRMP